LSGRPARARYLAQRIGTLDSITDGDFEFDSCRFDDGQKAKTAFVG
jgi:hypothetical protein